MAVPADAAPPRPRWHWLLLSFTRREILNRYAGSVWGLAWTLLHPLAQLAIFAFIFSQVFRVGVPPGYPGVGYIAFVAVALWPWIMFSEGLQRAMASVGANAGLIRKVAFPHRLVVYAAVLAHCAVHLVGFIVDPGGAAPHRRADPLLGAARGTRAPRPVHAPRHRHRRRARRAADPPARRRAVHWASSSRWSSTPRQSSTRRP